MSLQSLSFIVLAFLLVGQTSQASNFMSVSQNKRYANSGTVSIDISSAVSWNPYSLNVTYPFSFGSSPVLGVFLTISDMNFNKNSDIYNLSFYGIVNSYSQTSFVLYVYSSTPSNLISLGYRYTAFALNDQNTFGWILATVTQTASLASIATNCSTLNVTVPLGANYSLGFSQVNQYAMSFLGYGFILYNSSSSYLRLNLSLYEGTYTNISNLPAKLYACSYNYLYTNLTINGAYFNVLIYNRSRDPTLPYIDSYIYYYSWRNAQNNQPVYSDSTKTSSYWPSTLVSVNYTNFYGTLQFTLGFSDYSFNLSTTNTNFLQLGITTTWLYTYYCPYLTPYLVNNTCYDVCPNGGSINSSQLACSPISAPDPVSSSYKAGSILGYISFFLLLILIVAAICLYRIRQKAQQSQMTQPVLNGSNQPQSNQIIINQKRFMPEIVPLDGRPEIGVWRQNHLDSSEKCTLCNMEQTNFKTECGHSFHTKCIVTWSRKQDKCPDCSSSQLSKKTHRVFCRFCKEKEKWLSFRDLRDKYEENSQSQEFVCPSCLVPPL